MTIDEDLKRLEEIAQRLEGVEVPFEETVTLFEEGAALAKKVKEQLESARLRIRKAVEDSDGMLSLEDFDLE